MFWFSGHKAYGILASWWGIEPTPSAPAALEGEVLTIGQPGKFQVNILNLKLGPHFLYGFCVVFSGCSFHSPIQFPSFYKLRLKGLGLETGPNEWGFDGKPWLLILWNILPW